MTQRQLSVHEVELLYVKAVEIAKQHVGFHPAFILFDPAVAVRDWVQEHPSQALSLVRDYQQLLNRALGNSSSP